jgi:CheY-like chemotaxis protein
VPARILIVEDEKIIAADLRNKVRGMGHNVVGMAISGEEAITIAEQNTPDLVLIDVQLEGKMPGTDAARIIQERTGAKVVFITAFPGVFVKDPSQMIEPGICLGKPFSNLQLEAVVAAALGAPSQSS